MADSSAILRLKDTNGNWIPVPAVKGEKGENGDSGVYCGSTEPDKNSVKVWINPDGEPSDDLLVESDLDGETIYMGQDGKVHSKGNSNTTDTIFVVTDSDTFEEVCYFYDTETEEEGYKIPLNITESSAVGGYWIWGGNATIPKINKNALINIIGEYSEIDAVYKLDSNYAYLVYKKGIPYATTQELFAEIEKHDINFELVPEYFEVGGYILSNGVVTKDTNISQTYARLKSETPIRFPKNSSIELKSTVSTERIWVDVYSKATNSTEYVLTTLNLYNKKIIFNNNCDVYIQLGQNIQSNIDILNALGIIEKVDIKTLGIKETTFANSLKSELVAPSDLKTINGQSIVGSGNIVIQGGGGDSVKNVFPSYWEKCTPTEVKENFYINSSGVFKSNSKADCYIYTVKPNTTYWFVGTSGLSQAMVSKDADGNVIDAINRNPSNVRHLIKTREIYVTPSNCTQMIVACYPKDNTMIMNKGYGSLYESKGNRSCDEILSGKKWAICGDSYTEGDWSTNNPDRLDKDGTNPINFRMASNNTYPYRIEERTGIKVVECCKAGTDFTNASGAVNPFSSDAEVSAYYLYNYKLIPTDVDYITFQYGLNEVDVDLGSKGDTTNTTLWGAYDTVVKYLRVNIPKAKMGIIITDSWMTKAYHDELISIAKYYAIPYLDLTCYDNVQPNGCFTKTVLATNYLDATVNQYNRDTWLISESNAHPNLASHLERSYVVESFLKSL